MVFTIVELGVIVNDMLFKNDEYGRYFKGYDKSSKALLEM